ncbi:MAG: FAD-dependent oxidoreductase [Clostridia bacterium]|nr:FAD-dependent oxidoreductase [Clostridia bacterium]
MEAERSYWRSEGTGVQAEHRPPDRRQVQDIVIGGGMAGVLIAYFLQRRGREVVLLEQDRLGAGQTGGTTAKITAQHGLIYHRLIEDFGMARAMQYAEQNRRAIGLYRQLMEERGIDCGMENRTAWLYTRVGQEALKREAEAADKLGFAVELREESELPFEISLAMGFRDQALFQPLRFLCGMAKGLEIHQQTRVLDVRDHTVETDHGSLWGENIIFACHYPFIDRPGYYFARMHTERSYVLALDNAQQLEGMYLGIDQAGLSLRMDGRRLLLGGGSHPTGENRKGGSYAMLRSRAKELWKGSREAAAWSAQDCMTADSIPFIGRYSGTRDHWYVATGFNKWGMTSSMAAAVRISELICDGRSMGSEVFSPQRFSVGTDLRRGIRMGIRGAEGLARRLLDGEGRPTCPHMGCRLEWNPEENSWDCPCHGSRFDREGRCLNGPARRGIEREEL